MTAVPLAIPVAWSTRVAQHRLPSRNAAEISSDCLAHLEIFR